MQEPEKKQVLQAVRDLGRRVTVADVATKTGLSLNVVTSKLNQIAEETGGHLEVATTGAIAYSFAPGFQNAYLAKGFKRVLQQIGSTAFKVGFYLLRISFGIMLIVSLLLVVMLILVVLLRGSSDRDNDREGFRFDFFDYLILRDLFYWGAYSAYPSPYANRSVRNRSQGNFLLNCFSFLFGDGNPNAEFDERKWKLIAQVIRKHDGVVTSEQLAPYTGVDPKNENGVLPVLVRFDGRPEVSEKGNIIYTFPSLQVSAANSSTSSLPSSLKEWPWKFSNAPADALVPVYVLAGINFFGSWWLWMQVHSTPALLPFAPLISILVLYGSFFVGLPLIRYLVLKYFNGRIEARNQRKESFAHLLEAPTGHLKAKLNEATQYKASKELIGADKIVYSTEKDVLEQEFDANP